MLSRLERIRQEITQERLDLIEFARLMRKTATDAESLLWACLRDRRMNGRKFRRQYPVKPYVVDFYCAGLKLGIELDGGQHNTVEGRAHDEVRAAFMAKLGIRLMRFPNHELLTETEAVLNAIWRATDDVGP